MELPFTCDNGHANMVDVENLENKPLDKIYSERGFTCKVCGAWKMIFATCSSLNESVKKLENIKPERKEFRYHFGKTLKRAREIRTRVGNNG